MKPLNLADEIRAISQPAAPTKQQKDFERFLKCKEHQKVSDTLAAALSGHRQDREPAAPLIAPSHVLPPMF